MSLVQLVSLLLLVCTASLALTIVLLLRHPRPGQGPSLERAL